MGWQIENELNNVLSLTESVQQKFIQDVVTKKENIIKASLLKAGLPTNIELLKDKLFCITTIAGQDTYYYNDGKATIWLCTFYKEEQMCTHVEVKHLTTFSTKINYKTL